MAIKVGINGFGRIGRLAFRSILERKSDLYDVVAVNDLTDAETLAYLFKYDSVHGVYPGEVSVDGSDLIIDGDRLRVFSERDPSKLPWGDLETDVVEVAFEIMAEINLPFLWKVIEDHRVFLIQLPMEVFKIVRQQDGVC